jgi:hypothetical protein
MLKTILENQLIILMALRQNIDKDWLEQEVEKRLEATIEKLDEPPLVTKGKRKSKTY